MRLTTLALSLCLALPLVAQTGFQTHNYSAPADTRLSAYDMNRDGHPDLILFGGPLNIVFNNGSGGFGSAKPVAGATAGQIAIADFNKDGLPDIAGCTNASSGYQSTLSIYLNHGGGSFTKSYSASVPYTCQNIAAGDINRDGKADIVFGGNTYDSTAQAYQSYLLTYFGNGSGGLSAAVKQAISVAAQKDPLDINMCSLGSLVGDRFQSGTGRFDLVLLGDCQAGPTNGGTIYYATSSTTGHYTLSEISEDVRQYDYTTPYHADVNGDGVPDVVMVDYQVGPHGSWNTDLDFLVNNGGGSFSLKQIYNQNSYAASYDNTVFSGAAADFNGDHIWDAVAGYTHSPADCCTPDTPAMALLMGLGHYTYSDSQDWTLPGYPYASVAANLNGDSRPDIATLTHNTNTGVNRLLVYLNQGSVPVCAAPSSPGVHVCAPTLGSYPASKPIPFIAAGKASSGTIARMELWLNGKKQGNYPGATVKTQLTLAAGSYRVVFVEVDSAGGSIKSSPVNLYVY